MDTEIRKSFSQLVRILKDKNNLMKFLVSLVLLVFSIWIMKLLSFYSESFNFQPAGDLLHDLLPMVNLNFLATFGYLLIMLIIIIYFLFNKQKFMAKVMITMALFCIVRGILIAVTHIGAPSPRFDDFAFGGFLKGSYFTKDLFPSGHVGVPFLAFLFLNKNQNKMKLFFFFCSILMGLTVLLMHNHYSIDVFGAYFVTYGVFYLSKNYLWKYFELK